MVINQTQTMHIGKSTARGKKGKSLGLRVETVQTAVFRTNPQNTLIILAKRTDPDTTLAILTQSINSIVG